MQVEPGSAILGTPMCMPRLALIGSLVGISLSFTSSSASAQAAPCPAIELGMNVVLRNGKNVEGLKLQDFDGRTKHSAVVIDSLTFDTSPRRILLVLDMGRDLAPDARRAQLEIASYLVSAGRETDSFGLITARGTLRKVGFEKGHAAVSAAIAELRDKKAPPSTDAGILDAVLEGTSWFQSPERGDAIIVMASEIEKNKSAPYANVANALAKNRIRLFSIALGPIMVGTYFSPVNPFAPHNEGWAFVANEENLSALTWNSGGYMLLEETRDPLKEYKLSDTHLKDLLEEAARMYVAIATFYRLNVRVPPTLKSREGWKLDLTDDIRKKFLMPMWFIPVSWNRAPLKL
jgi:hypothetical protein